MIYRKPAIKSKDEKTDVDEAIEKFQWAHNNREYLKK
jgi:hypothetical protein